MTTLASGSSSAAVLLNPVNPSIATISMHSRHLSGREASQVLKTCLERPGTMSKSPAGAATVSYGRHVQDNGDVFVSVGGVALHVFIHADDTHAIEPGWIIDQQARPFGQDSGVGGIPGHAEGLGDACHRQMVDHQARQRPAHRRTRELGAWIGRLAHILAPHMGALRAPVAAYAHVQDRGAPLAGLIRQAPDHRVT